MHALPLSELRANIAAALDLVESGETVRITRHGRPVADLVPVVDERAAAQLRAEELAFAEGSDAKVCA